MKPRREILNRPVVPLVEDKSLVRLTQVEILKDADEAFDLLQKPVRLKDLIEALDQVMALKKLEA